jgi:hypothetical protein
MKPIRTACGQCLDTDTQYECERGECYAEHYQQQQEEEWHRAEYEQEQREWQRRLDEERGA